MRQKSIGKSALLNTINTVLGIVFPLITFPYVLRVLGVDNIGKLDVGNSFVSYFTIIAALGVGTYAIREGAIYREDQAKFNKFANQMFTINVVSTLFSYLGLLVLLFSIPKFSNYLVLILIQSAAIILNTIGVSWLYTIYEEYTYIVKRNILFQLISLLLLFVFVRNEDDYYLYAIITVVSHGGSGLMNLIHSRKYIRLGLDFSKETCSHLKSIMLLFANNVISTIYVSSDSLILGFIVGDYYAGLYSVSVRIYTILKSLLCAIFGVALPRISLYNSSGREEEATELTKKLFNITFLLLIPVAIGVVILRTEAVIILGGEKYIKSSYSLLVLMIALVFSILASLISTLILLPRKEESYITKVSGLSAAINIILNMFFIYKWQHVGAAITTAISEFIVFILFFFRSKIAKSHLFSLVEILKISLCGLAMIPISIIVHSYIKGIVINTVLNIVFCGLIYCFLLVLLKSRTFIMLLDVIKSKIFKKKAI